MTEPVARSVYVLPSRPFTSMSAVVCSTSAEAIWLATARFQISS